MRSGLWRTGWTGTAASPSVSAAGTGVPADFWLENGGDFDVMGWAAYVLNSSTIQNQVWSMSYGEGINGGVGGVIPVDYAQRFDLEMAKVGVFISHQSTKKIHLVWPGGRLGADCDGRRRCVEPRPL